MLGTSSIGGDVGEIDWLTDVEVGEREGYSVTPGFLIYGMG